MFSGHLEGVGRGVPCGSDPDRSIEEFGTQVDEEGAVMRWLPGKAWVGPGTEAGPVDGECLEVVLQLTCQGPHLGPGRGGSEGGKQEDGFPLPGYIVGHFNGLSFHLPGEGPRAPDGERVRVW